MGPFRRALAASTPDESGRRWVFAAPDQLTSLVGPLSAGPARELGLVVVETPAKAARRPYHQQKLALVLASQRHFALEQAARGVAVRHVVDERGYAAALTEQARALGPLTVMEPAERELRQELAPLFATGALKKVLHAGWLTKRAWFDESQGGPPYRMDAFYRTVRQQTGLLMEGGKPVGGRYSFDGENRERWDGEPAAPPPPVFPSDPIKEEVRDLITRHFSRHPGQVDLASLPATLADAEALWTRALALLPSFGPFEDAMSSRSSGLFHSRLSALLNLHRLLPSRVVREAAGSGAPLQSREGFVRQILGWREFVRHVHDATDGFRALPTGPQPVLPAPGDGGYAAWSGGPWSRKAAPSKAVRAPAATAPRKVKPREETSLERSLTGGFAPDGGACPSALEAHRPLPPAYWGAPSGLRCLDLVVADVWREAWSAHIPRLMVLGNLATLLGVEPRALTDWFWVAYADAYDWVVEPNVLGMATFGAGEVMTTKPYLSGAAYLDKMSDFCGGCAFDPKSTCPVTPLYWNLLGENEQRLAGNQRLSMPLASLRKRDPALRARDAEVARVARERLGRGERLTPEDLPPAPAAKGKARSK
jgi:deoxyribodipyrimidine photolyase-related protein